MADREKFCFGGWLKQVSHQQRFDRRRRLTKRRQKTFDHFVCRNAVNMRPMLMAATMVPS